jgi:hypothetical protein
VCKRKAAKFANHMSNSVCETLAQHRKIARICTLFKAYNGEWAWKSIRDHDTSAGMNIIVKLGPGNRTDIGKYSSVNMTIKLWNQLPAETLTTLPSKSHMCRNRVGKIIIGEEK